MMSLQGFPPFQSISDVKYINLDRNNRRIPVDVSDGVLHVIHFRYITTVSIFKPAPNAVVAAPDPARVNVANRISEPIHCHIIQLTLALQTPETVYRASGVNRV
nr:hypothetical protein Itr_chr03CG06270 [Ipomoea trifida]